MDFNPLSPESRVDPYPGYARLRAEAPVHEIEPFGILAVSRHADVLHALKHPELFSSAGMRALMQGQTGIMGAGRPRAASVTQARNLISTDPPDHDRLRAVVNRGFTPRRIAELEPRIRKIAEQAIDRVAASGEMDLVKDLSIPLPVTVIADLLGVPHSRLHDFKRWSDAIIATATGLSQDAKSETHVEAREEFLEFLAGIIAERRANPTDDLISTLIRAEQNEGALSEDEVLSFAILLLVAGNETTTNLVGNAVLALGDHPDQLEKILAEPALIPNLVEETVRYDAPVQAVFRQATGDTTLSGISIPEGKLVMLLIGSANRDERWLADADRFDVTREARGHLGFGFGVHFCLGASLARLEARVALETLFSRCPGLERTTDAVEWIDSLILRGPKAVPLRFGS